MTISLFQKLVGAALLVGSAVVAASASARDIAGELRRDLAEAASGREGGRAGEDKKAADIRAWLAAGFGLIHGFGFAYVLKEFGLPQAALAWSLFAFNVGVEIGQLVIVAVVAGSLLLVRKRSPAAAKMIAMVGSAAVILAGVYWFIERVFLA